MKLSQGSIKSFKDLTTAFLSQYTMVKTPKATGYTLLDIKQGRQENTRAFDKRFVQAARVVQTCSEELALATIRKGLLKGGPRTLRFDAHKREFQTLHEFVAFADRYVRAEEDADDSDKSRSPSPPLKLWRVVKPVPSVLTANTVPYPFVPPAFAVPYSVLPDRKRPKR